MDLRYCVIVFLMLAAAPAWSQIVAVRVELQTPREITVLVGQVYDEPIRFRLVRVDNGAPAAGVHVFISVNVVGCLPLLECNLPPPQWYGFWEGAGDPSSYDARNTDAHTDAQGEITTPRLVGGTMGMGFGYTISFGASPLAYPYVQQFQNTPYLIVNQVAPPLAKPQAISSVQPIGVVLGCLAMLACVVRRRRIDGDAHVV